jgi:mono/diheme cytochrome c family protein
LYAGWIYRRLEDPQMVRPGTLMPRLFTDGEAGRVERYAVARYLASLGGPARESQLREVGEVRAFQERGRRRFTSVGCIACHNSEAKKDGAGEGEPEQVPGLPFVLVPPRQFPLGALGSKGPVNRLADYLVNPLAVDPSGRMPHMLLQQHEALELAYFLGQTRDPSIPAELPEAPGQAARQAAFRRVDQRPEERAAFERLPANEQWLDLGRRVVIDKGCSNCHTIAPGGKAFASVLATASFDDIKKADRQTAGCLADRPRPAAKAPRFAWTAAERQAIRTYLRDAADGAGSPAPAFTARMTLQRFNCLACHTRDGEGGLAPQLIDELRQYQQADNAEAITPPPLTGIGHKLRTPWVRHVLTEGGRARPWMALRMPQFGEANVGGLATALAALEGTAPDETLHPVALSTAKITDGRRLVGKSAFGCISCHDLAGIPNSGTRGPDLAGMNQRVRYEWYRRWLEQPQRSQPGTRMPTIFPDGKSLVPAVLAGSTEAQADAMWAYLSLGNNLPLPEGMEPPKGLVLTVKDRPIMLRTFMPDAGSRAIAVGYPGSVATAFDAETCRLAYAWSGNFLDASPVWDGRGGNPARPLGPRFWKAPAGCPWGVNASNEPPDFAAQARDPAYGATLPEGQWYAGPRQVRFEGYQTDRAGLPRFEYRVQSDEDSPLEIRERPEPLHSPAGIGLARYFTLRAPARRTAWLLAAEGQEPRILDGQGVRVATDIRSGAVQVPAEGRAVVLPQGGGRAIVLILNAGPHGSEWYLRHQGPTWQAILRLPAANKAREVRVQLAVWAPYRDEPGLLKDLFLTR